MISVEATGRPIPALGFVPGCPSEPALAGSGSILHLRTTSPASPQSEASTDVLFAPLLRMEPGGRGPPGGAVFDNLGKLGRWPGAAADDSSDATVMMPYRKGGPWLQDVLRRVGCGRSLASVNGVEALLPRRQRGRGSRLIWRCWLRASGVPSAERRRSPASAAALGQGDRLPITTRPYPPSRRQT